MKIILHAGANKTGSTSIQQALGQSRASLAEAGVFYPLLSTVVPDEHWPLAALDPAGLRTDYMTQRVARDGRPHLGAAVEAELGRAIAEAKACDGVVLLSSESLGGRNEAMVRLRRLAEAAGGTIEAMIYLRPYHDLFVSGVLHMMKSCNQPLVPPADSHLVRHRALVTAFGADRVLSRVFARKALAGGDVVADFHAWLQERCQRPLPAFTAAPEVNKGMTAGAAALLSVLGQLNQTAEAATEYVAVMDFLTRHADALPRTKLALPEDMARHLRQIGASAWNAVLAETEVDPSLRAEFVMPEPPAPVLPYSEAETRAWVATFWSQAYLDAALALAATSTEPRARKVQAVLTRVFKPARAKAAPAAG